jgi:hypothetical protein
MVTFLSSAEMDSAATRASQGLWVQLVGQHWPPSQDLELRPHSYPSIHPSRARSSTFLRHFMGSQYFLTASGNANWFVLWKALWNSWALSTSWGAHSPAVAKEVITAPLPVPWELGPAGDAPCLLHGPLPHTLVSSVWRQLTNCGSLFAMETED